MKRKNTLNLLVLTLMVALFLISYPCILFAELTPIEDNCLEDVYGSSGISIALKNFQIFNHIDSFRYCATDNGYLEFNNIRIHNGTFGPYLLNFDFGTAVTDSGIIYVDAFETAVASPYDWTGNAPEEIYRGMTSAVCNNWDQVYAFTIMDFIFCDPSSVVTTDPVNLGQIDIGLIDIPYFESYISPPIDGSGFDFESDFQMKIDEFSYAYQINPSDVTDFESLSFENIYFGESFSDLASDDPRDPSTWKPNNNTDYGSFKIGDLFGDMATSTPSNPASINVAEGDIYEDGDIYGFVDINLPMQGSLRFESAQFDTVDFGPGAIDGINVYRLGLQLIP
ncbi:MAG: hypothetical protein PF482_16085 [Desulfobacteraceae bacterium]|nr:hypothetical protein [Desulfobacteraceae bacterium]